MAEIPSEACIELAFVGSFAALRMTIFTRRYLTLRKISNPNLTFVRL